MKNILTLLACCMLFASCMTKKYAHNGAPAKVCCTSVLPYPPYPILITGDKLYLVGVPGQDYIIYPEANRENVICSKTVPICGIDSINIAAWPNGRYIVNSIPGTKKGFEKRSYPSIAIVY